MLGWTVVRTDGSAVQTPQSVFAPRLGVLLRSGAAAGPWVGREAVERWPADSGLFCLGTSCLGGLERGEELVAVGLEVDEGFWVSDFGVQGEHY